MDRFAICQAFLQLEADYNVGGRLHERPSNQRRGESIACQLVRIGYHDPFWWVDIEAGPTEDEDALDEEVRDVYLRHVLLWRLPIDEGLMHAIKRRFTPEYLAQFALLGCRPRAA